MRSVRRIERLLATGGRTDIARMCLLCRHHTLIHNTQWTISVNPDGTFRATHPSEPPDRRALARLRCRPRIQDRSSDGLGRLLR